MKDKMKVIFLVVTVLALLIGVYTIYLGYTCLDTSDGLLNALKALPDKQSDSGLYFVCGILLAFLGAIGAVCRKPHTISFPFGQLALIMCFINIFYNKSGNKPLDIGILIVAALYTIASYPEEQERRKKRAQEEKMFGKDMKSVGKLPSTRKKR